MQPTPAVRNDNQFVSAIEAENFNAIIINAAKSNWRYRFPGTTRFRSKKNINAESNLVDDLVDCYDSGEFSDSSGKRETGQATF
jgi:hypothetical protein